MITEYELPMTPVAEATEPLPFLVKTTGLSKSQLKAAMAKGAVWLEHRGRQRRLRRVKATISPPDKLAVYYNKKILDEVPPAAVPVEDNDNFSIWVKPAGMLSGGSRFGDHCAIDRVIEKQLDRQTFIVHRLDRFAWGLMALAHNRKTAAALSGQFQDRTVRKIYQAIVHGEMTDPVILDSPVDGKTALSIVEPVDCQKGFSMVQVQIETGRKHQIREHLAGTGFPIAGDRQFGSTDSRGLQLAAVELGFNDPSSGAAVTYQLPEDQRPRL